MMNIYEVVTNKIIAQLEQGTIPWQKPWFSVNHGAWNGVTGRKYSLMNQMLLPKSGEWASYNQWLRVGGQVKQGEKASLVIFWKWLSESENNSEKDSEHQEIRQRKPCLKYYHVFHISQVDGVESMAPEELSEAIVEPVPEAERLLMDYINRERIQLESDWSDKACYSPMEDKIYLPRREQFRSPEAYVSTALHECGHSTGHESRLHRKGCQSVHFGSETYSKEELIAELTSISLMHDLGIATDDCFQNSASYIQSWMQVLHNDKRFVLSAAGQAEKAVKYIMGEMQLHPADVMDAGILPA